MRLLLVAAVVACLAVPVNAFAQGYPPPQPTPRNTPPPKPKCNTPGVLVKQGNQTVFKPKTDFQRGQAIAVRGAKECATSGRKVRLILRTYNSQKIGAGRSRDNGSYLIKGQIPTTAPYGKHRLEAHTSGNKYPASINVVTAKGSRRSNFLGSSPMLAAWTALGAFILAFFVGTRRRKRGPLATTASDVGVPMLDTSHFVPVIAPRPYPGPASTRNGTQKDRAREKAKPSTKPKPARAKAKPRAAKPDAAVTATKAKAPAKARSKAASKPTATTQRKQSRAPKARVATKPEQPTNGTKDDGAL